MTFFAFRKNLYTARQLDRQLKKHNAKLVHVEGRKHCWVAYTGSIFTGRVIGVVTKVHVA
jgi:hypothetical protein